MSRRPPKPENRSSIERALEFEREKQSFARVSTRLGGAALAWHLARLRDVLDPLSFAKVQSQFLRGSHRLFGEDRRKRRRPRDGSMPALVEPSRGPKPLVGGAAAPLDFG